MTTGKCIAIVGAGHNALVCACYLAQAGHDVTVYERRSRVGGAVNTEEMWPKHGDTYIKTQRSIEVRASPPGSPLSLGFGALLDHRFMLLTHQGRKSGHLFETVLEVVLSERATDANYVISGWGDKTDWYRNIRAHPALRVQVGKQTYVPDLQFLDPHEVVRVWTQFRHKHPIEERMALRLYSQPGMKYKSGGMPSWVACAWCPFDHVSVSKKINRMEAEDQSQARNLPPFR